MDGRTSQASSRVASPRRKIWDEKDIERRGKSTEDETEEMLSRAPVEKRLNKRRENGEKKSVHTREDLCGMRKRNAVVRDNMVFFMKEACIEVRSKRNSRTDL